MKDKGAKLIGMESQKEYLNSQKKFKPPLKFHEIKNEDNIEVSSIDSRTFLKTLGIYG